MGEPNYHVGCPFSTVSTTDSGAGRARGLDNKLSWATCFEIPAFNSLYFFKKTSFYPNLRFEAPLPPI